MCNNSEFSVIDMKKTGKWIKMICDIQRLPVKMICKELGLNCPQSVYAWFNGKTLPSLDNLYALSRLVGVPMDEMIINTKETVPERFQSRQSPGNIRVIRYYMYPFYGKMDKRSA